MLMTFFHSFRIYFVLGLFKRITTGVAFEDIHDVVPTNCVTDTQFALPLEQFKGFLRLNEHITI